MKNLLLFILFTFLASGLFAQTDTTRGPHTGRIESYANYRIEVLGCNDYLEVYFYDKKLQPIHNYEITGDVKFYFAGEVFSSVPLTRYGADGFTARIPSPDFYYCRVTASIGGQPISAKFMNVCNISVGR